MNNNKKRILFIGHDNLLRNVPEVHCDFMGGLGRGMGQSYKQDRKKSASKALRILWRLITGEYDGFILPSALLVRVFETGEGRLKRFLGFVLFGLSYSPIFCNITKLFIKIVTRNKPIAFIERFSQMILHRHMFQFFPDSIVFKTIAHHTYTEREEVKVIPTPYWINVGCYPQLSLKEEPLRGIDVFYSGTENCRSRSIHQGLYDGILEKGYNAKWLKEKVSISSFVNLLGDTKIAWSPEGTNWQCWRHYEALYYGAIPLINRPNPEIYHDLVHLETCLLYDDLDHALELISGLLSGEIQMLTTLQERHDFVMNNHSDQSVGRFILKQYINAN